MSESRHICRWCGNSFYIKTIESYCEHNGRSSVESHGECGCQISKAMKNFKPLCCNCKSWNSSDGTCNNSKAIDLAKKEMEKLGIKNINISSLSKNSKESCNNWEFRIHLKY